MKQKILPLLLALLTAYLPASAYDFMVDDLFYNINSDGTSVTVTYESDDYGIYDLSAVNIPESVTYSGMTYSVTQIGDRAFHSSRMTSVIIPTSVTSIGNQAFFHCSSLTSVYIPNSVTYIGNQAFYNCSSLTSVVIDNSVTEIGDYAFHFCTGLTSMSLGNSVTKIGNGAFSSCSSLTSVTIPNSVTEIGEWVFDGCSNLTSAIIGNSVTAIGNFMFNGCSSLTTIEIPNSVTSIGKQAFCYCSSLTSVVIPNSVTSIGDYAFWECSNLTNFYTYIEDPSSVPLGTDVFNGVPTSTCILHVPGGTAELYRAADQWSAFTNIVEDMTGIDNIATDHKSDGIYYNLLGQPVKNPTTGIYIYNGKKVFKK